MKILKIGLALLVLVLVGVLALNPAHLRQELEAMFVGVTAMDYDAPRLAVAVTAGPIQPRISLSEAGIDAAAIQNAVDYAAPRNTRALVIGQGGHIVFEKFWDGSNLDTPVDLSGFTPVLSALLLGSAMEDDKSLYLDASLSNYLPQWANDPRGAITLRQLLARESGLANAAGRPWPGSLAARYAFDADRTATLLSWPLDQKLRAGESPADVNADVLTLALEMLFKKPFPQMLNERVWQPVGAGDYSLSANARAGCCLRARLGDWMRIGEVLANDGVFEGSPLTHVNFVNQMLKPAHNESPIGFFVHVDGEFVAKDVVRLESPGKQRLWVVPSLKLVILRVGGEPDAAHGWDEASIPDSVIRGTAAWQANAVSEGVDPGKFAPH
jgi:CubicO group peptidase (beta-lactamase class C family)